MSKLGFEDHDKYKITNNIEVILLSIICHLEGKAKVFTTFSLNDLDNLSYKFHVCWLR